MYVMTIMVFLLGIPQGELTSYVGGFTSRKACYAAMDQVAERARNSDERVRVVSSCRLVLWGPNV